MKPELWRNKMKAKLDEELYRHCLGVAREASVLAGRFGADVDKAYFAGLIHDYGKRYSYGELYQKAAEYNLQLDAVTLKEGRLLHAPVGAVLIRAELGIDDQDVITAVRYHTTGRSKMTLLEKIIYLSDHIEPGRDYDGVEEIRALAQGNLNQALLVSIEVTIRSVMRRGFLLHPDSVEFRNALLGGCL